MGLNLQTHTALKRKFPLCVAVHRYVHLQVKIPSVGSGFRAGGEPQGGCELFDVGAGNRAWDFSKSSLCS